MALPAGAAEAAGRKAMVGDPAGDTVYDPYEGFVPQGGPAYADLLAARFKVTRGGTLRAVLSVADVPDGESTGPGRGAWLLRGKVVGRDGRKEPFSISVTDDEPDRAVVFGVGDRLCRGSSSLDRVANTVDLEIRLGRCAPSATRVRLHAEGSTTAAKPDGPLNPDGTRSTYNRPVYLDATDSVTLSLR